MINKLIELSSRYRYMMAIVTVMLFMGSYYGFKKLPIDALPDLTPTQVIVEVKWQGQSPSVMDDKLIYPLTSQFLSIPGITTVRGFASYESGLIYILFDDNVPANEARTRVLEQLSTVSSKLPKEATVALGPDATGVGWVYEYALTSDRLDQKRLRILQDFHIRYALLSIKGVSEVASIGGMVPRIEVELDHHALQRYNLTPGMVKDAIEKSNDETGAGIIHTQGFERIIQIKGYLKDPKELGNVAVTVIDGIPLLLRQIATIRTLPMARRGVADLNGKGEVVGGIVLLRSGEDVYSAIKQIKSKMQSIVPDGVEVIDAYDRSNLIEAAFHTLQHTLIEESLIVIAVIALFLLHLRSTLVILIMLPLTIGVTFFLMYLFKIPANIMSLGGIAIAIGAMVDATIVMIENAHKMLEVAVQKEGKLSKQRRFEIIISASKKVARAIFFALLLVTVSFLPIFALEGQEGKLFHPLAFTKTFAMAAGALLSITVVPALMLFFITPGVIKEHQNPLNRLFMAIYTPLLRLSVKLRYLIAVAAALLIALIIPLYQKFEWEFMPMLDEQSFMYMPVTPYGISIDEAKAILQKTDKIIASFPEVQTVFGKAGRADTATDPAPLSMIETIITFKPKSQWREGVDSTTLRNELDEAIQIPGLINTWTYPIRGRIDMLLSGIRTPLGIKLYGEDIGTLNRLGKEIEQILGSLPQTQSVSSDQAGSGYFLTMHFKDDLLSAYGLRKEDILSSLRLGVGGKVAQKFIDGIEEYPINIRLKEEQREDLDAIGDILIKTPYGYRELRTFVTLAYNEDAAVIKSENAKPVSYIYITPSNDTSASSYKEVASKALERLSLPQGYYIEWAGESEYLASAMQRLQIIIPVTILVTLLLIYFSLQKTIPALIVFSTLPFAMLGGLYYAYILDFNLSIATVVGFLALLGVAAETAIIMIIYLQHSVEEKKAALGATFDFQALKEAIYEGAVQRLRPKLMTLFAIMTGLIPIMYQDGVGSEVMQRIAAPMIGGVATSAILSLLVIPALYTIYEARRLK